MNHMPFAVEINGLQRPAWRLFIDVQQIPMCAIEAARCFAIGRPAVACEYMPSQFQREIIRPVRRRTGRTLSLRFPGSLQERKALPCIGCRCGRRLPKQRQRKTQESKSQNPHAILSFISYANARSRRLISSGVSTSTMVERAQTCPNGSRTHPYRSPQNIFVGGRAGAAPCFTACR